MDMPRNVVMATDHAGYRLKESMKKHFQERGIEVLDVGTFSEESVDYPAIMRVGSQKVLALGVPGLFFGGSGIGEAIAANKVRGIRAARCCTIRDAVLARRHNDANVMSLGGRLLSVERAKKMVDTFLTTKFDGGRHQRRVDDLETIGNC